MMAPGNFTALPILYSNSTKHYLYLREHISKPKKDNSNIPLPNGRTLFVVNIPPDATEREFLLFFKTYGHVERIVFSENAWETGQCEPIESDIEDESEGDVYQVENSSVITDNESGASRKRRKLSQKQLNEKAPLQVVPLPYPELPFRTFHRTGSTAHVVFTDPAAMSHALSLPSTPSARQTWPSSVGTIQSSGLSHYITLHDAQRPPLRAIKIHADTYIEVYEHKKALMKQGSKYRKGEAVVDEDGFTLVTRGGAYGQTVGGGATVVTKQFMRDTAVGEGAKSGKRGKKKDKTHQKTNFYKFQIHEQKRNELVDLKRHFSEDLVKIAKLKESKKYKPY